MVKKTVYFNEWVDSISGFLSAPKSYGLFTPCTNFCVPLYVCPSRVGRIVQQTTGDPIKYDLNNCSIMGGLPVLIPIELMRIPPISAGAGSCGNKILQA